MESGNRFLRRAGENDQLQDSDGIGYIQAKKVPGGEAQRVKGAKTVDEAPKKS